MTGIICSGANYGCALRLAEASDAAFQSALLALNEREPPYSDGILGKSAEESIRNIGKVIENMIAVDKTILKIMKSK